MATQATPGKLPEQADGDQIIEHVHVTPFRKDRIEELARDISIDRIVFGSDWPRTEGMENPPDFLESLSSLDAQDTRKVMHDNTAELTATAHP